MRNIFFILLILYTGGVFSQSKSISRFRSDFKENSNMFFYSSTLKMLNADNNPEFADILDDIEEVRVLNYDKAQQKFNSDDVAKLKTSLKNEEYNVIMMINEKGNIINLYSREKRGKTVGFVALVENPVNLVLIDLIGSLDVKKFMELKQKIDTQKVNAT